MKLAITQTISGILIVLFSIYVLIFGFSLSFPLSTTAVWPLTYAIAVVLDILVVVLGVTITGCGIAQLIHYKRL